MKKEIRNQKGQAIGYFIKDHELATDDLIEELARKDGSFAIAYALLRLNCTLSLIGKHAWGTDAAMIDAKSCMEEVIMRFPPALHDIADAIREVKDEM